MDNFVSLLYAEKGSVKSSECISKGVNRIINSEILVTQTDVTTPAVNVFLKKRTLPN